jgi:hypothetical protein
MIYVFGDSFSEDTKKETKSSYIDRYFKYKGREVKFYTDLLSENLNQPIKNFSRGGMCNDFMFLEFMKNYKDIRSNDIVIFGWSNIQRFLMPNNGLWFSNLHGFKKLSQETQDEITIMRSDPLFVQRQLEIIDFINNCLSDGITTIHWTWSTIPHKHSLSIYSETNGEIDDSHYSEDGHLDLYQKILSQLKFTNRVKINLWEQVPPHVVAGKVLR